MRESPARKEQGVRFRGWSWRALRKKDFRVLLRKLVGVKNKTCLALPQKDPSIATALGEILDLFVRAGWPDALRLTFKLDQAMR